MTTSYKNTSGYSFTTMTPDKAPIIVYSNDPMHEISPGQTVRAEDGERYTIGEMRLVVGNVYRITLLPIPAEQPA